MQNLINELNVPNAISSIVECVILNEGDSHKIDYEYVERI